MREMYEKSWMDANRLSGLVGPMLYIASRRHRLVWIVQCQLRNAASCYLVHSVTQLAPVCTVCPKTCRYGGQHRARMKRLQPSRPDRSSRRKVGRDRGVWASSDGWRKSPRTLHLGNSSEPRLIEASAKSRGSTVHITWPMEADAQARGPSTPEMVLMR